MLLGTEFYNPPPFKITKDKSFDQFTLSMQKDFGRMEDLFHHENINEKLSTIQKIYESNNNEEQFITLYANCLAKANRLEEARIIMQNHLKGEPDNFDFKMTLAMLFLSEEDTENAFKILKEYITDGDSFPHDSLTEPQFIELTQNAIVYHVQKENTKAALKFYAWTLKEEYKDFSLAIAGLIAGSMVKPMPEKFEEVEEEFGETNENAHETYFHHLETNQEPYYKPFANFHEIYIDEISLQDIRAIEAIESKEETLHDIRWLIKNEILSFQSNKGVFDPAGAKFAFILASSRKETEALEDILATFRLPELPYFEFIFKQYLFPYILNPLFHLGKLNIDPLFKYVSDEKNSMYTRKALCQVLKIISVEDQAFSNQINDFLLKTEFKEIELPEKYEIIDNKLPQLVKHYVDIPVDYFEEDESYEEMDSGSSLPESISLDGGGMISKPDSLEGAVFSNYLLHNMQMQQKMDAFAPPPQEKVAQLNPVVKPTKIGRNDPCPCGSGKKYKKCCLNNLN